MMADGSDEYRDKVRRVNLRLTRRSVVGLGAAAVASALLAACGGGNGGANPPATSGANAAGGNAPAASPQGTAAAVRGVTIPEYDNPAPGKPQGSQPSELVISFGVDQFAAHGIDPQLHSANTNEAKLRHIYEPLVKFERDLQTISPHLATEWKQVDPTTMQFKLRQGVTFQNGEPFNAEAARYSILRPLSPDTPTDLISFYTTIKGVDVVDDHTINVITHQPDPVLLARMSGFSMDMVPPKWAAQGPKVVASEAYGTGPYKLVSWKPSEDLVLEAWDGYWGEKPDIKKVRFHTITEAATRVAALSSGQVHVAKDMPPEDMAGINAGGRARISRAASNRIPFYFITVAVDVYKDKRVRQAINYAANVDGVIAAVLVGNGYRVATVLPVWTFGYDPSLKPYPNDPDKAKQLLKDAGHPDGIDIDIWYIQGRYTKDKEVAEAMAQEMAKGGIRCKTHLLDNSVFNTMEMKSQTPGLNFASWGNPFFDADGSLLPLFGCDVAKQFPDFRRPYGCNPQLDKLLNDARVELDTEKRKQLYAQAQRLIYDDGAALFMYQLVDIYGVNNWVQWQARHDEMIWAWEMKWNNA